MTLLEKANKINSKFRSKNKSARFGNEVSHETLDLTVAFLKREINFTQFASAFNKTPCNVAYSFIVKNVFLGIEEGKIIIK